MRVLMETDLRKMTHTSEVDVFIGEQIARLRRERGLSLAALSAQSAISENTIERAESGQVRLDAYTIVAFAKALDVQVSDIFPAVEMPADLGHSEANVLRQACFVKLAACQDLDVLKRVLNQF
jgi:transcriptional regulator with XRE-family HTH domain